MLQSVAWTRMVVEFAQTDSLAVAVEKTFDGEHPCPMCQKIQRGREKESAPGPLVKWEKLPEGVLDVPCVTVPAPAELESSSVWGAPRPGKGTVHTPPKPPPRLA